MTKSDIVNEVSSKTGLTKVETEAAFEGVINSIILFNNLILFIINSFIFLIIIIPFIINSFIFFNILILFIYILTIAWLFVLNWRVL